MSILDPLYQISIYVQPLAINKISLSTLEKRSLFIDSSVIVLVSLQLEKRAPSTFKI